MARYKYVVDRGCTSCDGCRWDCPADAITIDKLGKAVIDQKKCIMCGTCYDNCASEAISKIEVKESQEATHE